MGTVFPKIWLYKQTLHKWWNLHHLHHQYYILKCC